MRVRSCFSHGLFCAAVAALAFSSPAFSADDGVVCSLDDISPAASACEGFFTGNVISNSPADLATASAALQALGLTGASGEWLEKLPSLSGNTIDFATQLNGMTVIGMHFGKALGANPPGVDLKGGGTAFYKFDAGVNLDFFTVNVGGLSNAALYSTQTLVPGIPEPQTYALMLSGLGLLGFVARRRQQI